MNKKEKIQQISILDSKSIIDALKLMDDSYKKLLLVFTHLGEFKNVISIGDIQRAIINNKTLDTPINNIIRKETRVANKYSDFAEIKSEMLKYRTECMPVIDSNKKLIDVYFWEDVFAEKERINNTIINIPVVIMAGGKGSRMRPITNVIPKPLIPIGDKTIIEEIMDRFLCVGCDNFLLSVNYKSETIKHYFEQLNNEQYNISYFKEDQPLGTAGSLFLIKDKINSTFFVSNCDIIIEEDYAEILKYHQENKNELTIVSAIKTYPIPYGTLKTRENGLLKEIREKPQLTFQINTGFYILEPHLFNEIPENSFFHITQLIDKILLRKGKVGVFPVSEKSWKDIGQWNEYIKMV